MTILTLHRLGDPMLRIEAVSTLETMLANNVNGAACFVHDANMPFPDYLKDIKYDAIVLGPTFLTNRHYHDRFLKILADYDFIKNSNAVKIALPQDDYDSSAILDQWMVDWKISRVYTVCSEHWDLLYPKYIKVGEIKLGYTGYINNEWIEKWQNPLDINERPIDVSYRTHDISKNRCYLRNLKYRIADDFKIGARESTDLILDISNDRRDFKQGLEWHRFIENSKACLVTPSGSSLLDPDGSLRRRVEVYSLVNPSADYEQTEAQCYHGLDNRHWYTGISPRNIEAALAHTVQIATLGSYSNLMKPSEHYILLEEDCSNSHEVAEMIRDLDLMRRIASSCKELFLETPRLREDVISNEITQFIGIDLRRDNSKRESLKIRKLVAQHKRELDTFYKRARLRRRLVNLAKSMGVRSGYRLN